MTTTSPLPKLNSDQLRELGLSQRADAVGAYRRILKAESRARSEGEAMLARVLGHLLLELYARRKILGDQPFEKVSIEVTSSPQGDDSPLFGIGQRYLDRLIRACASDFSSYQLFGI